MPIMDGRTLAEENERVMMEGLNQIPDTVRNAVMVLGRTGSGKSALINMLAGRPLIAQQDEVTLKFFLTSEDMLPGITIGNLLLSETSIPRAWVYNDTVFWDCPGFDDNRGIEYEISHAFMFKKLFDTYQSCKIILVISDDDLNDRRAEKILPAIRALDLFFQSDIQRIRSGLMLVVSGSSPDKTIENIQQTFKRIINTVAFNLTRSQKAIFRLFAGYDLCLMSDLPAEGNIRNPEMNVVYLAKNDTRLEYVVLSPTGNIVDGELDLEIQEDLTREILNNNKNEILTGISEQYIAQLTANPIVVFHTPTIEGVFDTDQYAETCLNTTEHLGVINDLHVNPTISPASQVVLLEMYANLLRSTNLDIDNLMNNLSLQLQSSIARAQNSQNCQELTIAIETFQEISDRFDSEEALSNDQLLLEIIPACMQVNINQHIELPLLSLRNMLYKTEIFDFLEQFVERHARTTLGIEAAITGYLSNCMRDARATIQAIELQQTGERITTLQFDLQRESAARIAADLRTAEMTNSLKNIEKELKEAQKKAEEGGKTKYVCQIM